MIDRLRGGVWGQREQAGRWGAWRWAAVLLAGSIVLPGCPRPPDQGPPGPGKGPPAAEPLRIAVLDDPGLAQAVERQWQARAEGRLEVLRLTTAEFPAQGAALPPLDAILYPSGLMGALVEGGWIGPLPADTVKGAAFARRDIFDLPRQQELCWGEETYAVPLGSPQLMLVYRRDVFAKLDLKPPRSWAEYAAVAKTLAGKGRPAADTGQGSVWHGTAEPWGAGWAGQMLLARAAGYARHRSYFATLFELDSMQPQIASPPFVRALEELVAVAPWSAADARQFDPAAVRRELRAGRCALGITWPARPEADDAHAKSDPAAANRADVSLAVAELPGSTQVYHPEDRRWEERERTEDGRVPLVASFGRVGSVAKTSTQPQAAVALLLRLAGKEWAEAISPHSPATTLFRTSQMGQVSAWVGDALEPAAAKQYAELLQQIQRRPLWLCSPRLPGRARYLAALDQAVHEALQGTKPPAACLQAAAERWHAITRELGTEKQKAAYLRSLGQEP